MLLFRTFEPSLPFYLETHRGMADRLGLRGIAVESGRWSTNRSCAGIARGPAIAQ